ncbi:MAG: hypothetical protein HY831_04150, partial [Candidatus Aenigmarchaeota archaeon]|nr:hypothetical protein [Candidatus Aenigmarchaeota archaeon]
FGYRTFLPGYSERVQIKNFEDGYLTGELPQAGFKPTQKTIEYYTELFKNRKIKIDLKKDQEKKDKESSDNTEQQD